LVRRRRSYQSPGSRGLASAPWVAVVVLFNPERVVIASLVHRVHHVANHKDSDSQSSAITTLSGLMLLCSLFPGCDRKASRPWALERTPSAYKIVQPKGSILRTSDLGPSPSSAPYFFGRSFSSRSWAALVHSLSFGASLITFSRSFMASSGFFSSTSTRACSNIAANLSSGISKP
jgi:hypothetical protein